MKIVYIVCGVLLLISTVGIWYRTIKNKKKKKLATILTFFTFAILGFMFYVFQLTGIHELPMEANKIIFEGAEIIPKKTIIDKDSKSVTLIVNYKNLNAIKKENGTESLNNKGIDISAEQDSENLDDIDKSDIYSTEKVNSARELKFTIPTNNYNQKIKWTFTQKNGESHQIISDYK